MFCCSLVYLAQEKFQEVVQSERVQLGLSLSALLLLVYDTGEQGEHILSLGLNPMFLVNLEFNQALIKWKPRERRTL